MKYILGSELGLRKHQKEHTHQFDKHSCGSHGPEKNPNWHRNVGQKLRFWVGIAVPILGQLLVPILRPSLKDLIERGQKKAQEVGPKKGPPTAPETDQHQHKRQPMPRHCLSNWWCVLFAVLAVPKWNPKYHQFFENSPNQARAARNNPNHPEQPRGTLTIQNSHGSPEWPTPAQSSPQQPTLDKSSPEQPRTAQILLESQVGSEKSWELPFSTGAPVQCCGRTRLPLVQGLHPAPSP